MQTATAEELTRKRCVPCEGGVPTLTPEEVESLLKAVPGWRSVSNCCRIRREWTARNFFAAIGFFNEVAAIAEFEWHHPDLNLENYRDVTV